MELAGFAGYDVAIDWEAQKCKITNGIKDFNDERIHPETVIRMS